MTEGSREEPEDVDEELKKKVCSWVNEMVSPTSSCLVLSCLLLFLPSVCIIRPLLPRRRQGPLLAPPEVGPEVVVIVV